MRNGTATAFLIHGYLGAGKTTLARRLEAEKQAVRFTHDEWMRSLYGDDPPQAMFRECALRVSNVIEATWTRCVTLKMNVILDFGFWSRQERDRVRGLVASLGGEAILYRLACPDDVAWERISKRNQRLESSLYISPNTFEILKAEFEPLDPDEERVAIQD
ncbi:AAA family ATPase [Methylosinus sp. Sm6]|uniref:AAA family ATPase n=1 Tax=Methylosinus sp. Sm6 TaxID=2866948 RepID=UPI001C991FB0|nr:AAA family ATPase [Methylosinus sp. Sm6]MBY6242041.1 AAA family ATPase [Methylosinus sp. Sm6]